MPPNFPARRAGISPETGNGAKRPKMFRRYAPGDSPPDFPTHINDMSLQPFFSTWPRGMIMGTPK
jgi:hypothetical protein